jgi:hypothetical protein
MTSCEKTFNEILLSKSVSKNIEKAKQEWLPVISKNNYDLYDNQFGYYYQNRCHSNHNDNCKCQNPDRKLKDDIYPEHCRWPNYRNLKLNVNKTTNYSCICEEPIVYVYKIKNKLNGNKIPSNKNVSGIGSECLKKFLPECFTSFKDFLRYLNEQETKELYEKKEDIKIQQYIKENKLEKICPVCNRLNRRKNLLKNEFVSCKNCPPVCCIMDCKNISYKKNLCKSCLK